MIYNNPEFEKPVKTVDFCRSRVAHLRERAHDKPFYKLCAHMEPDYHQLEFEVRVYLTHLEATGERLWAKP